MRLLLEEATPVALGYATRHPSQRASRPPGFACGLSKRPLSADELTILK